MKKITALLLAVIMLLCILPVVATAEDAAIITAADFVSYEADGGVAITDYSGTQNGVTFTGIKAEQLTYQPRFYFTAEGISNIKSYAEANGYDCLTIHAWGIFSNNSGVINNQLWFGDTEWQKITVDIADLDTDFFFLFGSEQTGTMYLWFEFSARPIVDQDSFAEPYWKEQADGSYSINSVAYQPHFYFSQAGIDRMKAYAEKHDVDTLLITGKYSGTNCLVLNNKMWIGQGEVKTLSVKIADMTTAFDIWSQSETGTTINLKFEAYKAPLINAASFQGNGVAFEDVFGATVAGETVDGVHITSVAYQPHFYFKADAISTIKAYAEENGFDTLRIHAYADLYNNMLVLNNMLWVGKGWAALDVSIDSLSTAFDFFSGSESTTDITMWFEFYKAPVINATSFTGLGGFTNNPDGTISLTTAEYQPHFYFTEEAVAAIKAYAEENGLETLRITVDYQGTNALVLNNKYWVDSTAVVPCDFLIADLTADFDFWIQSESVTNLTLSFEFLHLIHDYQTTDSKKVTCLEDGYTTYVCTVCGDTYTDTFEKLGHDFVEGFCSRCGLEESHEHNFIPGETVMPTCTDDGYTVYTCTCGESYKDDFTDALGHDYADGVCSRCGDEDPNYVKPDPCEGYTDIDRNKWYHEAADFVIERGIMGSTQTDALTFEPMTSCTRSMIVMILYNLAGKPEVEYEAKFPDVPDGKWFTDAVIWAYKNNIVSGYDNGKFGPNDKVTREQMAVVLKGYADFIGRDTSKTEDLSKFPDGNKATWSKPYISWAVAEGLISGKAQDGKTYLDPQGVATRAEVAALIRGFVLNILGE